MEEHHLTEREINPGSSQEYDQRLRKELIDLSAWLGHLLHIEPIDFHVSAQEPLTAAYKWNGSSRDDRFLLSVKITRKDFKIQNLWIPKPKRNRGAGSTILVRLRDIAVSHGIQTLFIEPRPGSEGFWLKAGFIPIKKGIFWEKQISDG